MWTVAIIDDDFHVLEAMKKMIPWDGLDAELVGVALDGDEGLRLIQQYSPDIVITDIYMPVMDGMQMIEVLRKQGFGGRLIILSGYSHFDMAKSAMRHGVQDYLVKPVTLDEITSSLTVAIEELQKSLDQRMMYSEMKEKLMLYEPFVAKEAVKALLTNSSLHSEEAAVAVMPGPQSWWTNKQFVVAAFELQRTTRVANVTAADWSLFRFAITNVMEETAKRYWPESHIVELHGSYWAVLLHVDKEVIDATEHTRRLLREITGNVISFLQLELNVGIGQLQQQIKDIPMSMEEALQDLYKQSASSAQGQSVDQAISALPFLAFKFYQQLYQAFLEADEEEIQSVVRRHMTHLSEHEPGVQYLQSFAHDMLDFFRVTLDHSTRIHAELDENMWRDEVSGLETSNQLDLWLQSILMSIFNRKYLQVSAKHKQVVDFMIQYIHENYATELQLETLAQELYLTKNYLNQIFKKAMGETFNIYLTKVRMEKAKTMLMEGKYMIYEVSNKVGYKNIRYFSTLFKKIIGVNPSDYVK